MVIQNKFNQCATRSRNDYVPKHIRYDQAMFTHPPDGLKDQEKRDFIDIIMIIKHLVYLLRFKENLDRVSLFYKNKRMLSVQEKKLCIYSKTTTI